jgi:hypothetical protein
MAEAAKVLAANIHNSKEYSQLAAISSKLFWTRNFLLSMQIIS